jgi:hypothetical protein
VRPRFGGTFAILNASSVEEGLKPLLYGIILKETQEAPRDPDIYSRARGGVAVLFVKELLGHDTSPIFITVQ